MIKVQDSAESRPSFDLSDSSVVVLGEQVWRHKFAAEALMIAFAIVVLHKLTKEMAEMCFAEDHKMVQTFFANCSYEALSIRVAVRALRGNGHAANAGVSQEL